MSPIKKNKKNHLRGNWSATYIQIARVIEQYPYKRGKQRQHINTGEKYREGLLAGQLGTSASTMCYLRNALIEGAIIPTDEEFAAAEAAGINIPLDPKREPTQADTGEISRLDMKKDVDQIIVNQEEHKAAPVLKVAPVLKEADKILEKIQRAPSAPLPPPAAAPATPAATPPAPAPAAPLPPFMAPIEAKNNGDKPGADKVEKKAEEPKDKKMLVGGELFGNVQKVKLTMGTIFWYFWCVNVYGFEGTMDEFINWAVTDAISARGLSLDVRETQIPIPQGGENVERE